MLNFVILDKDIALNSYYLLSWDYSAHVLRYTIVLLLLNMRYLYEFMDNHSVAVSQAKNDCIQL